MTARNARQLVLLRYVRCNGLWDRVRLYLAIRQDLLEPLYLPNVFQAREPGEWRKVADCGAPESKTHQILKSHQRREIADVRVVEMQRLQALQPSER